MASSLATSASASASASAAGKVSFRRHYYISPSKLSFRLSRNPTFRLSTKGLESSWNRSSLVKAQLNEVRFSQWFSVEDLLSNFQSFMSTLLEPFVAFKVPLDGSSNSASTCSNKSELPATEAKDANPSSEPSPAPSASEESISEFVAQVANLVKLVDSRDIVELQLKQFDCELLIRKKEVLSPPPASASVMMQAPTPPAGVPPAYPVAPPAAPSASSAPSSSSGAAPPASLPAPKSAKSSHPPLKCPMAGTFYRSPAPGEPPFVKVGDKVQKGQVLCIIEAMKLMNEIEADQSGTVVEILVEHGKSVSVDMPLFMIEP